MKRTATAKWQGDLKTGKGNISTQSGVLKDAQYGFNTRFEDGAGTNPEELIGAAHAGCFTMALSGQLAAKNVTAKSLETTANVHMEKLDAGWTVTKVDLFLKAEVPGISKEDFETATNNAKTGCPISRLLNTTITLTSELIS